MKERHVERDDDPFAVPVGRRNNDPRFAKKTRLQHLLSMSVYKCCACGSIATESTPGLIAFMEMSCSAGVSDECGGPLRRLSEEEHMNWALNKWQLEEFGPTRHGNLILDPPPDPIDRS
jgi:hypothetical protein